MFIGTNRGLENDLVPRAGYGLSHIEAYGLKKDISLKNLSNIIKTLLSSKDAEKILKDFKPDIVIGTGGYICGPVFKAATKLKIPTILHESNAYPGKAVKMFSKKADEILVGFEAAKEKLTDAKKVVFTGTPTKIRKVEVSSKRKKEIFKELGIKSILPIVLVFGGSQGAQSINKAVEELVINKLNKDYQIIWATGAKQFDLIKEDLEKRNLNIGAFQNVKMIPYIYNMEELMNISDLMVCRSGAMTITEIAIVEKPAIFIPLPSMSANRQEDNARVLEKLGAAKIILNDELNSEILAKEIDSIIKDEDLLFDMGEKAGQIAPYDVEEKIYNEIINVLKNRKED